MPHSCYSFATMPITRNAKKALRVSQKKNAINSRTKKSLKEGVKAIGKLVESKNWKDAKTSLSAAYSAIDKAAKNGVIKKNTANRKKARLYVERKVRRSAKGKELVLY